MNVGDVEGESGRHLAVVNAADACDRGTTIRVMSPVRRALALVFTVLVLAGCNGGGVTTTTSGVTFGEGEIPEPVPDDFPIPANAVIGTTLVDKVNNNTEFRLTLRSDPTSAVQFFEVGLVNQGYVVESSEGNQTQWTMEFSKGELRGEILFTAPQNDLTAVVVGLATS